MIVRGVTATRNQLVPVPLDPGSAIVPVLDDGAHDIASELVRDLTHPQLDLLGRLGARLGTKLLATQCEHPGGRLDDPRRQAGKIDGRRLPGGGDTAMGMLPMLGFETAASYRFCSACGAFAGKPSPCSTCRRDGNPALERPAVTNSRFRPFVSTQKTH